MTPTSSKAPAAFWFPVNDSQTMADLMVLLGLPVIVAARTTLGTINHTLLTLEALRARSLKWLGSS